MDNIYKTQEEIDILKTTLEMFNILYSIIGKHICMHLFNNEDLEMIEKFLLTNHYTWIMIPNNDNPFLPESRYYIQIDYYIKEE